MNLFQISRYVNPMKIISYFLGVLLFVASSCLNLENKLEESTNKQPFLEDTLVCNTNDIYIVVGDTIPLLFMEKESLGMLLTLHKNGDFLFQDTLFPNAFGAVNLWETKNIRSAELNIHYHDKKYNLFLLNEDMLLISSYFESQLYSRYPTEDWKAFDLHLYPNYISQYARTHVFPEDQKICFVGENWDLIGNPYKGDSLVVKYENGVFEIDKYYPKSKLSNVTYHE